MPDRAAPRAWTCARCEVTASWMEGVERPQLPASWAERDGGLYCLSCQRELAGEAGLAGQPDDLSAAKRQQLRSHATVEFEVARDPDRGNTTIAQACRTSIP